MPQLAYGDMWKCWNEVDLFLISTNSTLAAGDRLVMGRGIAQQARDNFPGIDQELGLAVLARCGSLGTYGLLVSPRWPRAKLGCFQVKYHFQSRADLDLIRLAAIQLRTWCADNPEAKVALNFPGIGNGRLSREEVLPELKRLPDQVTIWEAAAP